MKQSFYCDMLLYDFSVIEECIEDKIYGITVTRIKI